MLDNIIGVEEAAAILGLSPGTVKNYCAQGKIKAKKIGKTWVMDKTNLKVVHSVKSLIKTTVEYFGKTAEELQEIAVEGEDYTITVEQQLMNEEAKRNFVSGHYFDTYEELEKWAEKYIIPGALETALILKMTDGRYNLITG